jgi:hypothetical protein
VTPIDAAKYLSRGFAYMRRLRAIEDEEARHLRELDEAWKGDEGIGDVWRERARTWDFRRINRLVESHNAYYPIEASVPMNPRTGGYAKSWHRDLYDAEWILRRFPPRAPR